MLPVVGSNIGLHAISGLLINTQGAGSAAGADWVRREEMERMRRTVMNIFVVVLSLLLALAID